MRQWSLQALLSVALSTSACTAACRRVCLCLSCRVESGQTRLRQSTQGASVTHYSIGLALVLLRSSD